MKRFLLSIAITLLSILNINAQMVYFDGKGVEKGYRGFVDLGYTVGVGDFGEGRAEIQTAHGYQFLPYLFTGVGMGMSYFHEAQAVAVPIFADFRTDIFNNSVTPFIDFKIGYSVADVTGFYMSPSVGCRFSLKKNLGLNITIGYTMQNYGWEYSYYSGTENCGGLNMRLGIDF